MCYTNAGKWGHCQVNQRNGELGNSGFPRRNHGLEEERIDFFFLIGGKTELQRY